MGKIIVYNSHIEDHTNGSCCNFYIGRGSPLGNPFSHNGVRSVFKTLTFKTREEAIEAYDKYFDKMYGNNEEFTKAFDEIYKHYKNGEDVYLQCFCKPKPCHGDIIAKKLQIGLIKEKMKEKKDEKVSNEKKN
jgi:hypothetical protein